MIQTELARSEYIASGSQDTFPYTFKIFNEAELLVLVNGAVKILDTDYTVTGEGNDDGGNIIFASDPSADASVIILRNHPASQLIDLAEGGPFPAETIERGY